MNKKRILVVLDGLGDLPSNTLNNKTPLESANTPYLDKITKNSRLGYMYTIKENIAPESDSATLAILGYDPYKSYTGRGPLEAAGISEKLGSNFLALRANFATVKSNNVIDRRVGRGLSTKEAKLLADSLNKNIMLPFKFKFIPTIQHRGVLIIYKKLSDNISNTDPAYIRKGRLGIAIDSDILKPCNPLDKSKASKLSAEIINSFTSQAAMFLESHKVNRARIKRGLLPANYILLRNAGNKMPALKKKKDRWLAVAGMPLEIGLARLSGMHAINFKLPKFNSNSINKSIRASLIKTINVANSSLRKHWSSFNSFYIHIKETDIPGHDGNPTEKKRLIELIDKRFFKNLSKLQDCIICITGDHSTPCRLKRHSADPVPVLIYGKGTDNLNKFSEINSKMGSIGKIYGKNLLKLLY